MNSDSLKKLKLPLRLRFPLDVTIDDTGSLVVRRGLSEYQGSEGALYLGGMNVAQAVLRHHAGKDVYYIEIVAPRENVDDDRLLASTVRLELVFGIAEQPENMPLELAHGATVSLRPLYPIKEILKNDAATVAEHESSSEPAPDPSEPTESSAKKGPMSMEEIDDLLSAISKGDAGASPSSAHGDVALSLDGLIVAKGETVLDDDRFGIRITEAVEGDDRFALMERPDAGLIRGVAVLASRSIALADLPDLTEGSVITMDATALGPSVLRFDNGIVHAGEILFGDAHDAGWAFRRLYSLEEITRSLMQDRMRAAAFASDDGEGDIADGATDVDEVAVFIDSPMDAAGATMGNEDMSAEDANARRWAALEAAEAEMTDEHESTPEELFPDEIRQQLLEHAQSIDFMDAPSFTKENLLTLSRIIKNMCLSMGSAIDDLLSLERSVHLRLKRARVAPFSEFHVDDGLDSMPWSIELDPNLGFVFVKPGRGPLVSPEGVDKVLELMGETSADSSSNISIETWVHMYLTLTICDQLIRAFEPLVAIQTRTQSFDENAETGAGFVSPVTAVPADARSALFEIAIENGDVRNAITLAIPLAGLAPIVPILEQAYLDGAREVPEEIRELFSRVHDDDDYGDESADIGKSLARELDGALRQAGKELSDDFQREIEESGIADEIRKRQVVQPPTADRLYDIAHDLDYDGDPPEHPVQGRIFGETFVCQKAGVKTNGEIGLLQGDLFTLPMISVNIKLDMSGLTSIEDAIINAVTGLGENYSQYVSISMTLSPDAEPVFETYRDYRLKIVTGVKEHRKMPISLYLAVPDEKQCVLAGSAIADVEEVVYYETGSPPPALSDDLTPEEVASIAASLADPVRLREYLEDGGDPNIMSAVSNKPLLVQIADMWTEGDGTVSTTFVHDATHYGRNFSAEDCVECARMLLEHGAEVTNAVIEEANTETFLGSTPKAALLDMLREYGYETSVASEDGDGDETVAADDEYDTSEYDGDDASPGEPDLVTMMAEVPYFGFLDAIAREPVPPGPPPKIAKENLVAIGKLMRRLCAALGEHYSADAELWKDSAPDTVTLSVGRMRVARFGEIRDDAGENPEYLAIRPHPLPGVVFVAIPADVLLTLVDHTGSMEIEHGTGEMDYGELLGCEDRFMFLQKSLAEAWGDLLPLKLHYCLMQDADIVNAIPADVAAASIEIEADIGGAPGSARVIIPLAVIAPVMSILTAEYIEGNMEMPEEVRQLFLVDDSDEGDFENADDDAPDADVGASGTEKYQSRDLSTNEIDALLAGGDDIAVSPAGESIAGSGKPLSQDEVNELLGVRECDTYPDDMPWERRLPIACYLMDHAAIREFIDQGGDPNLRDEDGETPLETLAANWFDADPGVELTRVKEMHGIRMERIVGPDDARECAYLLLDAGARVTKLAGERAKEGSSIDGAPKRELIRLLRECLIARKDGTPFERWWEIPARTDSREASETKVMSEDQIDDLLASISSESTGPFAHAEELFAEGEYLEAIDAYLQAMKEAGENAAAHNNIGLSYLNLGEYEKALKYFKKSLQVDPDYATALANQACAYKRMGDIDRAIAVSTEALARGETGDILYNLACYTAINGDAKTAMAYLKRAIDHDERFREMAADDDDFAALEDSKDFRKLVG